MSDDLSLLNDEDVRNVARLIENLERSTFDFLQLEVGELKVTIGKGTPPQTGGAVSQSAPAPRASIPAPPSQPVAVPPRGSESAVAPAPEKSPAPVHSTAAPAAGSVEIKSPIMGMYYAQSEPGAAPFVSIGQTVEESTTIALIEVMKTFNAVPAGIRGKIVEICVQNSQLVEFGQVLYRVMPA